MMLWLKWIKKGFSSCSKLEVLRRLYHLIVCSLAMLVINFAPLEFKQFSNADYWLSWFYIGLSVMLIFSGILTILWFGCIGKELHNDK